METYKNALEIEIKGMFKGEGSGHDVNHLERVYNLALSIQAKEGGDRLIIGIAAYLHDIHRLMQNEKGVFVHPTDSLDKVRLLLQNVAFPERRIEEILHCIAYHEEYSFSENGRSVHDIETLILQDADNLDAIGAIGIGRSFAYGSAYDIPMWLPDIPLDYESSYDETIIGDPSTIHPFTHKLLRLGDSMNTQTGKIIAKERILYMQGFVERFMNEWKGVV